MTHNCCNKIDNCLRNQHFANFVFCLCAQIECPEFPEDLKHWMSFISASSQALRAESGLEQKNK